MCLGSQNTSVEFRAWITVDRNGFLNCSQEPVFHVPCGHTDLQLRYVRLVDPEVALLLVRFHLLSNGSGYSTAYTGYTLTVKCLILRRRGFPEIIGIIYPLNPPIKIQSNSMHTSQNVPRNSLGGFGWHGSRVPAVPEKQEGPGIECVTGRSQGVLPDMYHVHRTQS